MTYPTLSWSGWGARMETDCLCLRGTCHFSLSAWVLRDLSDVICRKWGGGGVLSDNVNTVCSLTARRVNQNVIVWSTVLSEEVCNQWSGSIQFLSLPQHASREKVEGQSYSVVAVFLWCQSDKRKCLKRFEWKNCMSIKSSMCYPQQAKDDVTDAQY